MIARRLAGQLVRFACQRLPEPDRTVRYQEWTAEVAAILDDQGTRSRTRRKVSAVAFAADHIRGTRRIVRQARFPTTGWRAYTFLAFPLGVELLSILGTYWLPVTHPVRLTLVCLLLAAGMTCQVIRERRYWLSGSRDEFDRGRGRRVNVLVAWFMVLGPLLTRWLTPNTLVDVSSMAVSFPMMRFVERRIFAWRGSVEHQQTGQGPAQHP